MRSALDNSKTVVIGEADRPQEIEERSILIDADIAEIIRKAVPKMITAAL